LERSTASIWNPSAPEMLKRLPQQVVAHEPDHEGIERALERPDHPRRAPDVFQGDGR
jgi:hypothetical protein